MSFRALSKMTARQRDRALATGRIALLINEWIDTRFALPAADIPPDRPRSRIRSGGGPRPLGTR